MNKPTGQDLSLIKPLLDAFQEHSKSYSDMGSDYSVTTLLQPPRLVQLERRYKKEIETLPTTGEDLQKALGSFRGNAIHDRFERMLYRFMANHPDSGYLIERRLWDRIRERKISGKFDCFLDGCLYDFKTTSVWKKLFGDHKAWEEQLNAYAYLLRTTVNPPVRVNRLAIIAWYMDFQKTKVFERGYPKTEVEEIEISNIWAPNVQEDFLFSRIELHKENEQLADDQLTHCTKEDRWEKDTVYAVRDPNKPDKAIRLKPSQEEAEKYIAWGKKMKKPNADKWFVELRPGRRVRCEDWCKINVFCDQYQEYMQDRPVE